MDRNYFYRKRNRIGFIFGINKVTEFQSVSSLFSLKQVVKPGIKSSGIVN